MGQVPDLLGNQGRWPGGADSHSRHGGGGSGVWMRNSPAEGLAHHETGAPPLGQRIACLL